MSAYGGIGSISFGAHRCNIMLPNFKRALYNQRFRPGFNIYYITLPGRVNNQPRNCVTALVRNTYAWSPTTGRNVPNLRGDLTVYMITGHCQHQISKKPIIPHKIWPGRILKALLPRSQRPSAGASPPCDAIGTSAFGVTCPRN